MRRPPRRLAALLLIVCATVVIPAAALADGDPASDVLLGQDVYYPYQPNTVSASLAKTLNAETAATDKAGYSIKVALIANAVDLGVVPSLFGKPQKYADFLVQEITFQGKQHLLVVMAAGYGVQGMSAAATAAAASLAKPGGKTGNDLAKAAIAAVPKLAKAAGHPISAISGGGGSRGGATVAIVIVLIVVALGASAGVLVLRRQATPTDKR